MRNDIIKNKNKIKQWVSENKSKSFICLQLNCRYDTLQSYLTKFNISYKGNQGSKGRIAPNKKPIEHYLKEGKPVGSHRLKLRLIKEGLKKHSCEICKNETWNGKKIPIHLHHIDGDKFNNKIKNLQILCPNCHAQTENFGSRNKLKFKDT